MEQSVSLDNRGGFTLIEFCVAVLIMMVGLLGLLQAINIATSQNIATLLRNEAIMVADEQMIAAKYASFDSIKTESLSVNKQTRSATKSYSVFRNVTTAGPNSKEVTISVRWDLKGKTLRHDISSLVVKP